MLKEKLVEQEQEIAKLKQKISEIESSLEKEN